MHSLNFKNYNILSFPKCGCTTLIKLCSDIEKFKHHNHSYEHNNCDIYKKIHVCSYKTFKYNNNHKSIVIYRYPHERLISFYNSNYIGCSKEKFNFNKFIDLSINDQSKIKGIKHHTYPINKLLRRRKIKKSNITFIHLSKLNDFWKNKFNIDISNINIINKTNKRFDEMDEYLLEKIKNSSLFKEEYNYLP